MMMHPLLKGRNDIPISCLFGSLRAHEREMKSYKTCEQAYRLGLGSGRELLVRCGSCKKAPMKFQEPFALNTC